MKKKVLLTRKLHDFALMDLKKYYDIEIHQGKVPMPKKTLLKKIRNRDGLICFPYDSIDKDVLSAAKKLKTISGVRRRRILSDSMPIMGQEIIQP